MEINMMCATNHAIKYSETPFDKQRVYNLSISGGSKNQHVMLGKHNITLIAKNKLVSCHKCILTTRSPVFCAKLQMKRTKMKLFLTGNKLDVTKHIHPAVLKSFVNYFYSDPENIDELMFVNKRLQLKMLLCAAMFYDVKGLIALCSQHLIIASSCLSTAFVPTTVFNFIANHHRRTTSNEKALTVRLSENNSSQSWTYSAYASDPDVHAPLLLCGQSKNRSVPSSSPRLKVGSIAADDAVAVINTDTTTLEKSFHSIEKRASRSDNGHANVGKKYKLETMGNCKNRIVVNGVGGSICHDKETIRQLENHFSIYTLLQKGQGELFQFAARKFINKYAIFADIRTKYSIFALRTALHLLQARLNNLSPVGWHAKSSTNALYAKLRQKNTEKQSQAFPAMTIPFRGVDATTHHTNPQLQGRARKQKLYCSRIPRLQASTQLTISSKVTPHTTLLPSPLHVSDSMKMNFSSKIPVLCNRQCRNQL